MDRCSARGLLQHNSRKYEIYRSNIRRIPRGTVKGLIEPVPARSGYLLCSGLFP